MVHLQPEREHALYSCRVLCYLCKQQFKSFPNFFFFLWTVWILAIKIADLGKFQVTKSEALRYIIPLNTVKSQKSVYLPFKTGQLQCVVHGNFCNLLMFGRWQSLCWELTIRSTASGCFTPSRGDSCVCAHQLCLLYHTSSSLLLVQGPPLGCSVPRQNQQGMFLNFTRAVHTSRVLWDWRPEIWNPKVVNHSRSCLQDVSFQHWYASL